MTPVPHWRIVGGTNTNKNRPKILWQILKEVGSSTKCKTKESSISLDIGNELCFDKVKVATHFNDFFTSNAASLVNKLPACSGQFGQSHVVEFYRNKHVTEDMFSLANVTVGQVSKILHSMSSSKATGLDEIPAKYLKDGSSVISKLLTHIINLSITTGSIPDDLKMARIVPLYMKNSKTNVGNYRPISVLSVISEVFEKVVFMQLSDYLSENRLLYEFQSGFRSSYSTDTCLIHLTDYIKLENDTGMVLLDLQKAFDTVDHTILLNKLKWLGADDLTVQWFRSYLTGRTQVTDIGGTMSEPKGVTCGVPQGSILGPLLFLLYVNDMASAVRCKLLLYADDSALIASGKNVADIESTLSSELEYVSNWLIDNKLSLHLDKTQSILFGTKRRLSTGVKLNVICNGNVIESKSNVTYLGVTLDQFLSGEIIASNILYKSSNKLKFIYRNAGKFNLETKKLLISALIQCHFDYTCSAWYNGLSKKLKCRMQCTQNKIIRFMLNAPWRFHVGANEFKHVGLLPIEYRVEQLMLGHMFNIINGNAPTYLISGINMNQHRYSTRARELSCVIPRVKSSGLTSFMYQGICHWNNLPLEIKQCTSKDTFKYQVKCLLYRRLFVQETSLYVRS